MRNVNGRIRGFDTPRLLSLDSRNGVAGGVGVFGEVDVGVSVLWSQFLRNGSDGAVGGIDSLNERVELCQLVLGGTPCSRGHGLDHDDVTVRYLDATP